MAGTWTDNKFSLTFAASPALLTILETAASGQKHCVFTCAEQ